jgi:hypothetical protein
MHNGCQIDLEGGLKGNRSLFLASMSGFTPQFAGSSGNGPSDGVDGSHIIDPLICTKRRKIFATLVQEDSQPQGSGVQ